MEIDMNIRFISHVDEKKIMAKCVGKDKVDEWIRYLREAYEYQTTIYGALAGFSPHSVSEKKANIDNFVKASKKANKALSLMDQSSLNRISYLINYHSPKNKDSIISEFSQHDLLQLFHTIEIASKNLLNCTKKSYQPPYRDEIKQDILFEATLKKWIDDNLILGGGKDSPFIIFFNIVLNLFSENKGDSIRLYKKAKKNGTIDHLIRAKALNNSEACFFKI